MSRSFQQVSHHAGACEVVTHDGETSLTEDTYTRYFANGITQKRTEVLFAEQEPTAASQLKARRPPWGDGKDDQDLTGISRSLERPSNRRTSYGMK
jgi:hypothetical protein